MSNIDRIQPVRTVLTRPVGGATLGERLEATRAARALARVANETTLRLARVQEEGIVQTEKVHELDHLTREAITGHAMLHRWASTLANGDPFISEDLRFFLETNKLGKGEVLADTITTYCRESRGC